LVGVRDDKINILPFVCLIGCEVFVWRRPKMGMFLLSVVSECSPDNKNNMVRVLQHARDSIPVFHCQINNIVLKKLVSFNQTLWVPNVIFLSFNELDQ
jgi:hypothetical protein